MDRKKLVQAYMRAWGDADLEALLRAYAPDFVLEDSNGGPVTREGLITASDARVVSERVAYYCKHPGRGLAGKGRTARSGAKTAARRTRSSR